MPSRGLSMDDLLVDFVGTKIVDLRNTLIKTAKNREEAERILQIFDRMITALYKNGLTDKFKESVSIKPEEREKR